MKDKLYLICYDFPSTKEGDRRRARLIKILKGQGVRVQKSVFETRMKSNHELKLLLEKIKKIISPKEDSIRFYPFDQITESNIHILGEGEVFEREEYYIF
jgi:CRISPR-associated protein Cas2